MHLRYGVNPGQSARAVPVVAGRSPLRLLAGRPSYINLLDALNAWQLVRDAAAALGRTTAASFKHVTPAGAAMAGEVDEVMADTWKVAPADLSAAASAYVRARDCDPRASFGDFVAVSDPVDRALAAVLASVYSDGIVAPGFEPGTVEVLAAKKRGSYLVVEADPAFEPPPWEGRDVFGLRLEQESGRLPLTREVVAAGAPTALPDAVVDDMLLAMITARYTPSNSVAYARAGMVIGVGAGQQSRVDSTKLGGVKADVWWLRRHEAVRALRFPSRMRRPDRINSQIRFIEEAIAPEVRGEWLSRRHHAVLASDGYIPFRDNVDEAARHGVVVIAEPGGSARSREVEDACAEHGITLVTTGVRLFHH